MGDPRTFQPRPNTVHSPYWLLSPENIHGPLPQWICLELLKREVSWRIPELIREPPQFAPFGTKQQQQQPLSEHSPDLYMLTTLSIRRLSWSNHSIIWMYTFVPEDWQLWYCWIKIASFHFLRNGTSPVCDSAHTVNETVSQCPVSTSLQHLRINLIHPW